MERASPDKVGKRCPKGALWANDNGKWTLVEGYWKGDWSRRNARSCEMCAEWEAGEEWKVGAWRCSKVLMHWRYATAHDWIHSGKQCSNLAWVWSELAFEKPGSVTVLPGRLTPCLYLFLHPSSWMYPTFNGRGSILQRSLRWSFP